MHKKTLAVIFGGASTEYEVSLRSATSVLENAPAQRFDIVMIGITKDGRWLQYTGGIDKILDNSWLDSGCTVPAFLSPDTATHGLVILDPAGTRTLRLDVVFPVLHGKNGEDGTIQGLLEMSGIPYVGCGVLASADCMDKAVAKNLFTAAGIPNARWLELRRADLDRLDAVEEQVASSLGYPAFVKPANSGSSVGVACASDPQELHEAIRDAFRYDAKVIIEEAVKGHEVECAVMGGDCPLVSDVIGEINPVGGLYDYAGKYLNDAVKLNIPALVSEAATERVRSLAVRAYRTLGCRGLARIDFFVRDEYDDGRDVVLNEINTMPGFTSISMYPKLFLASGYTYPQLVEKLIDLALESAE